jgi:hypothetical protein
VITTPFYGGGAPFFTGEYSLESQLPFTVTLDGRDYPIDLTEYRHNGLAKFREGVVTSSEPNDQLFNSQGAWWRYRYSWHLGAGQEIADLDADAIPFRFDDSRRVDPWNRYRICLQPATERKLAVTAAEIAMVATSQYVYVSDGTGVKRSADLTTWATVTGLTGTVNDMTTDGINCYIATSTAVYTVGSSLAASATSTATPTTGFDRIEFVGNRLIVADANKIGELTPTTLDDFYTHYQVSFRWTAIFQVGSRIYVGGFAGNRSELFSVTTLADGSLALSAEASTFFIGELLNAALSYGGAVILATTKGVRFATLAQDATLQYGPLIEAPGDSKCVTAEGRFAWFGWDSIESGRAGIGRMALDEFVDVAQPPYAADLSTGLDSGDVVAITRFGGKTLFAVSADGVFGPTAATYETEGWVTSGAITFGTVEDKSLSQIRLAFSELDVGESVSVEVTDRFGTVLGSQTASTDGSVEMTLDLSGEETNQALVKLTLRGDNSSTACVNQWRMRGYPVAPGTEEWLVPLIIHSDLVVNDGQGQRMSVDPWEAMERIREKWLSGQVVLYREGAHTTRVRIDNFQIATADWRDGSDWFEITCVVRLLSV